MALIRANSGSSGSGGGVKSFYKKYVTPGGTVTETLDFEPSVVVITRAKYGNTTVCISIDKNKSTTYADYWANGSYYHNELISSYYEYNNGVMTLKFNASDDTDFVYAIE